MTIICVDISHYQAGFDFGVFRAAGGLGVIMKASEGATYQDGSYKTFRSQALAAGLKVASYHFLRTGSSDAQALHYLDCAQPAQGERVVCDWEDDNCSTELTVNFLKAIQLHRPDVQLTVYSGHTCKEKLGSTKNEWLANNTALWIAQYASKPIWPTATWPQWSLWQYTDQTPAPGFSGPVDQNRFNGSDENFVAWMGPAEPSPEPRVATVTMALSSDIPFTLIVNGQRIDLPGA